MRPVDEAVVGEANGGGDRLGDLVDLVANLRARRGDLAGEAPTGPLVVGIAGGVAAGKTVVAGRLARALSARHGLATAVVSSDGFLRTNAELEALGLGARKGWPESYDTDAIEAFLTDVRAGTDPLQVPEYDHLRYDVRPGRRAVAQAPVVVFEGVNVLRFADRLDLGVYVDAPEPELRRWFLERLRDLLVEAADVPDAYLAPVAHLDPDAVAGMAETVWEQVNLPNLREAIEPTRDHADVVVVKGPDHTVREVRRRADDEPPPRPPTATRVAVPEPEVPDPCDRLSRPAPPPRRDAQRVPADRPARRQRPGRRRRHVDCAHSPSGRHAGRRLARGRRDLREPERDLRPLRRQRRGRRQPPPRPPHPRRPPRRSRPSRWWCARPSPAEPWPARSPRRRRDGDPEPGRADES